MPSSRHFTRRDLHRCLCPERARIEKDVLAGSVAASGRRARAAAALRADARRCRLLAPDPHLEANRARGQDGRLRTGSRLFHFDCCSIIVAQCSFLELLSDSILVYSWIRNQIASSFVLLAALGPELRAAAPGRYEALSLACSQIILYTRRIPHSV